MSSKDAASLPEDLQELIVDVVEGRCAADDVRVEAARKQRPEFAEALAGSQQVRRCLEDLGRNEAAALAAPASHLDAVAEAAVRRRLASPAVAEGSRLRPLRWLPLLIAAILVLGFLWPGFFAPGSGRKPGDTHLQQAGAVVITFDPAQHELVLAPAPERGESYRVEFGRGDAVVETLPDVRSARLSVPDLRRYLPGLWVRAVLCEVGEDKLPSTQVPVPADFWRN